jgi:hypothetical protein
VYIKHREVEPLGSLTGLELGKPPVSLGGGFSALVGLRPVRRLRKCPASNWAMETGRDWDFLLESARFHAHRLIDGRHAEV